MNKKSILSGILSMATLFSTGCEANEQSNSSSHGINGAVYRKIDSDTAYKMINEPDDKIVLDVRTEEEFAEEHIENAICIPDYELSSRIEQEIPDKSMKILVYCRSGARSYGAAMTLVNMGYNNIYDFGGIINWNYETIVGE